ncbi:MAG: hypothetical protein IJZ29_01375 [Clostridia bacterium]|nr:hypothetical protein [Clostridia bacterium]
MELENKYEDSFCKKVNQAIMVSEEFAKNLNGKLSYVARVMPINYKPKGTGKWARVYLSTKTTKELKKLKSAYIKLKLKKEDEVALKLDETKMNVTCLEFAIKFKEITREVIAGKVSAQKEERADWDELLENLDLIGLQICDACEYFESLGRYNYGKKRKKKQAFAMQNQVNLNNLIKPKAKKVEAKKEETQKVEMVKEEREM